MCIVCDLEKKEKKQFKWKFRRNNKVDIVQAGTIIDTRKNEEQNKIYFHKYV